MSILPVFVERHGVKYRLLVLEMVLMIELMMITFECFNF